MKKKDVEDFINRLINDLSLAVQAISYLEDKIEKLEKTVYNKPHGLVLFPKD